MSLLHRYDFVLLFDVQDGNPNGDPDAGNLPRMDAETGQGIVTDVSLKRKVRNYVELVHGSGPKSAHGFEIYVREKAVLNQQHERAYQTLGLQAPAPATLEGEDQPGDVSEETVPLVLDLVSAYGIPDQPGDVSEETVPLKKSGKPKAAPKRKGTGDQVSAARQWMCQNFYDVRTFGAVMSTGDKDKRAGQVRGPVQLTFARSVDPITALEFSITRMAVATEKEAEKQGGDNRTMGRKHTVPYGLYVAHGFVSAHLAGQTGFNDADLQLLWQALTNMFEHDRSAARGMMTTRGLYVFEHESLLGNAPAFSLFERIKVQRRAGVAVPRHFTDYDVAVQQAELPPHVQLHTLVG